jgi:hypothetical protein
MTIAQRLLLADTHSIVELEISLGPQQKHNTTQKHNNSRHRMYVCLYACLYVCPSVVCPSVFLSLTSICAIFTCTSQLVHHNKNKYKYSGVWRRRMTLLCCLRHPVKTTPRTPDPPPPPFYFGGRSLCFSCFAYVFCLAYLRLLLPTTSSSRRCP